MKRGTASRVVIGGNTMLDLPKGLVFGTDVILGGIAGLTSDFNGLVLSNTLMLGKKISHISVITVIVRGQSPLNLPYAIADSLHYVKAFGGTEQRNLPDDYIERQFIYMMDGSYLLTDIVPTSDCKIEFDFQTLTIVSGARTYLGCRDSSGSNDGLRVAHISNGLFRIYGFGTYADSATAIQANTRYKFVWNNKQATITTGGTTIFDNTFAAEGTNQTAVAINGWNTAGTVDANSEGMYLYSFKVWDNQGNLIADYVPAIQKGTVPVVGFYDTVSGTFKTATAGTFAAGGEAVPTPDAPMDIVSNNGVLKVRHQSGLPLGYTLLEYIESSGTQYIDTGVYVATGYKVRVKAYATSVPTTIAFFGCTSAANTSSANKGIFRLIGSSINRCAWGNGGGTVIGNLIGNDSINTWYDMVCDNGVWTINDTLFATVPASSFTAEYSMWLFARNTGGTVGLPASCRISVCQIWDNNGQMIRNFVPAKNSSNVVGMYDLVSEQFFTNQGTGTFTAGSTVSDPVEIYTDGTVETINMHGKNLFDKSTVSIVAPSTSRSDFIRVVPGVEYSMSARGASVIIEYDSERTELQTLYIGASTYTPAAGTAFARFNIMNTYLDTFQIELGSTATPYEPYYDGGTATTEMLLKVGDYQDVQSILDGVITRNVGVKVLDGTESWTRYGAGRFATPLVGSKKQDSQQAPISSHFIGISHNNVPFTDGRVTMFNGSIAPTSGSLGVNYQVTQQTADFKQWLADQYAAGTPVIVIYPLATATTESVAGQTLQVTDGDNIVEITQASMNGLELEASYDTGVVAIIQEVQDVNLNNNVTVTIE